MHIKTKSEIITGVKARYSFQCVSFPICSMYDSRMIKPLCEIYFMIFWKIATYITNNLLF